MDSFFIMVIWKLVSTWPATANPALVNYIYFRNILFNGIISKYPNRDKLISCSFIVVAIFLVIEAAKRQ